MDLLKKTMAHLSCILCLASLAAAQQTVTYPYGVMPANADYNDAKAIFEIWAQDELSNAGVPNPGSMLRLGHRNTVTNEYMGHGMICVAVFDQDSDRLKKMFNFVKHFHNSDYHMQWKVENMKRQDLNSALDGIVDVVSACILADKKWPNEVVDPDETDPLTGEKGLTWGGVARKKLIQMERVKRTIDETSPDYREGFHQFRPHNNVANLGIDALAGTHKGFYINYLPYALFDAFSDISENPYWRTKAKDGCYEVINAGFDYGYKLPAWFTNWEGKSATPNDPWNSGPDRWDGGPSRTAWRVSQAYLTEGHPDALAWAKQINSVYVSEGDIRSPEGITDNIGWGYSFIHGTRKDEGINPFMVGAAGISAMAAGDQVGTDNCYAWLKDPANYNKHSDKTLKRTLHALYMAVMVGAWDVNYTEKNTSLHDAGGMIAPVGAKKFSGVSARFDIAGRRVAGPRAGAGIELVRGADGQVRRKVRSPYRR